MLFSATLSRHEQQPLRIGDDKINIVHSGQVMPGFEVKVVRFLDRLRTKYQDLAHLRHHRQTGSSGCENPTGRWTTNAKKKEFVGEMLVRGPGVVTSEELTSSETHGQSLNWHYDKGVPWLRLPECIKADQGGHVSVQGYLAFDHVHRQVRHLVHPGPYLAPDHVLFRWPVLVPIVHESQAADGGASDGENENYSVKLQRVTDILNTHPQVTESCVVGVQAYDDDENRMRIAALVVTTTTPPGDPPTQVVQRQLMAWCRRNMDDEDQVPELVKIADFLPRRHCSCKTDNVEDDVDLLEVGKILLNHLKSSSKVSPPTEDVFDVEFDLNERLLYHTYF